MPVLPIQLSKLDSLPTIHALALLSCIMSHMRFGMLSIDQYVKQVLHSQQWPAIPVWQCSLQMHAALALQQTSTYCILVGSRTPQFRILQVLDHPLGAQEELPLVPGLARAAPQLHHDSVQVTQSNFSTSAWLHVLYVAAAK